MPEAESKKRGRQTSPDRLLFRNAPNGTTVSIREIPDTCDLPDRGGRGDSGGVLRGDARPYRLVRKSRLIPDDEHASDGHGHGYERFEPIQPGSHG